MKRKTDENKRRSVTHYFSTFMESLSKETPTMERKANHQSQS